MWILVQRSWPTSAISVRTRRSARSTWSGTGWTTSRTGLTCVIPAGWPLKGATRWINTNRSTWRRYRGSWTFPATSVKKPSGQRSASLLYFMTCLAFTSSFNDRDKVLYLALFMNLFFHIIIDHQNSLQLFKKITPLEIHWVWIQCVCQKLGWFSLRRTRLLRR